MDEKALDMNEKSWGKSCPVCGTALNDPTWCPTCGWYDDSVYKDNLYEDKEKEK